MALLLRHRLRHPRGADRAGTRIDEIRQSIGADSLGYIDLDQLIEATNVPKDNLCRACFDGIYPIPLPEDDLIGKHLLENPGETSLTVVNP